MTSRSLAAATSSQMMVKYYVTCNIFHAYYVLEQSLFILFLLEISIKSGRKATKSKSKLNWEAKLPEPPIVPTHWFSFLEFRNCKNF